MRLNKSTYVSRRAVQRNGNPVSLGTFFPTLLFLYGGMIGGFLLQQIVSWNDWVALMPRQLDITTLQRILLSWTAHGNFEHLKGNALSLMPFVIMLGLLERKPISVLITLTLISNSLFWLLSDHSAIGASGVFFALFGYMAAGALIVRNWKYIAVVVAFGLIIGFGNYQHSFLSLFQTQQGVSTFGHWSGFIAGIILAIISLKSQERLHQRFM